VQLTTLLLETLKSGKVIISQNNTQQFVVNIESSKKIDVNATDKKLIKEALSSVREATTKKGLVEGLRRDVDAAKEASKMRPLVKEIVEDLCREGITITVSYKGDRVITVGSEADSQLTRFITKTKGIEINNPLKLAQMGI
jgi:hypothetical protein